MFDMKALEKMRKRTGVRPEDLEREYAAARGTFDAFAGMDAPLLPPHPIDALQVRLVRWQSHNFGAPNACEIACGIAEEVGERAIAAEHLDRHAMNDAVGDIMVYLSQLCTARRLSMSKVCKAGEDMLNFLSPQSSLTVGVGYLAHVQLKDRQGIRGMDNAELARFGTFVGACLVVRSLNAMHHDYKAIWQVIAEQVLQRDWTKDRASGGEVSST